jgi:hypothetical protein
VPNVTITMSEGVRYFRCTLTKDNVIHYEKKTQHSKLWFRAEIDKDTMKARSLAKSERTDKDDLLAKEVIHFVDEDGNFDEEQVYEHLQDLGQLLDREELRLLNTMRTPTPDASIELKPSDAIMKLLDSQEPLFGSANGDDAPPRLLLNKLVGTELDLLTTCSDLENVIKQVAQKAMESAVAETDFDQSMSMTHCRIEKTMEDRVKELVGDGKDLSEMEKWETSTTQMSMELVMILVEQETLLGLVSGRLQFHKCPNGRMAIWAMLSEGLRKFCCIGAMRSHNLPNRVADFRIAEGCKHMVSPNSFEMS